MRISIVRSLALALAASCLSVGIAQAGTYDDAVMALSPSHYYPMQETKFGDVANMANPDKKAAHDGIPAYDDDFLPPDPSQPRGGLTGPQIDPGSRDQGWVGAPGPDTQALVNRPDAPTSIPLAGFGANPKSLFANNSINVELGPSADFASNTMTVAMWFKTLCSDTNPAAECDGPPASNGGERLFTNNMAPSNTIDGPNDDAGHLQIDYGWGANLIVSIDPRFGSGADVNTGPPGPSNFQVKGKAQGGTLVVKNESWHHMVVSRNGDAVNNISLVVDGVEVKQDRWNGSTDSWGTTGAEARFAGRGPAGPDDSSNRTFSGWMSHGSVWLGKQLTVSEARQLYRAGVNLPNNGTNIDANGGVDAADAGVMFANWASDADPLSDINSDLVVDAADAGAMFENWTGDPAAAAAGTATAEYNAATGQLIVDANSIVNFYVQSASGKIVPISPAPVVGAGQLLTNNANRVGVTGLSAYSLDNFVMGNIGANIPASDLVLVYNGALGTQATRLAAGSEAFRYIPEPASFGLIGMGLLGLLATRRRS